MDSLNNIIQIEYGDDLETAFQKICKMYLPYNSSFDPTDEDDRKVLYAIAEGYLCDAKLIHTQPTSRIVKGGSWASSVIYLQPGSRMVFPEERTSCTIGFRVAMTVEDIK